MAASSRYQTQPEDCTQDQLEAVDRMFSFIHRIKPELARRRALRESGVEPIVNP
jgi:hypothetical protein